MSPASDGADASVADDEPASEQDAAVAATEGTDDAAAADPGDEQASVEEGTAGAEEGTPEAEKNPWTWRASSPTSRRKRRTKRRLR